MRCETNTPEVSIIVPIYKAEKYLRECIDSILTQTYTAWELLLVDDGSPDKSGDICDTYAENDCRIRVFHKKNGGVSSARNSVLAKVNGKWLMFVDSDDCLYSQALEIMLSVVEDNKLDLVQCCFNRTFKEGQISELSTKVMSASQYVNSERYLTCVWGGLFRNSIIRKYHLTFNETVRLGEDQLFLLNYMQHCSRLQRIGEELYFYRNNESSAVNNSKPEYEFLSVKAFKAMKMSNPIALKRCDVMLLSWFVSLTLVLHTPTKILFDLYKDVRIDYISPRARKLEKLAFRMLRINSIAAIALLRAVYILYHVSGYLCWTRKKVS